MIQESWSPGSWKQKPTVQQVTYPELDVYQRTLDDLAKLPALVTSCEVESLKTQSAEAAAGRRFLLQGGDCSECFAACQADLIARKLKILLRMSLVLTYDSKQSVIRVGRFASLYVKPRSSDVETRDDVSLPVFRGENINQVAFMYDSRIHDPARLLRGYERSTLTLNFIRALVEGVRSTRVSTAIRRWKWHSPLRSSCDPRRIDRLRSLRLELHLS